MPAPFYWDRFFGYRCFAHKYTFVPHQLTQKNLMANFRSLKGVNQAPQVHCTSGKGEYMQIDSSRHDKNLAGSKLCSSNSIDGFATWDTHAILARAISNKIPSQILPLVSDQSVSSLSTNFYDQSCSSASSVSSTNDNVSDDAAEESMFSSKKRQLSDVAFSSQSLDPWPIEPDTERVGKRFRANITTANALHHACQSPHQHGERILALLQASPSCAGVPLKTLERRKVYNRATFLMEEREVPCSFMYPLNIALSHGASNGVIEALVDASPNVVTKWDGPNQETALHILLRHETTNLDIVDKILLKIPSVSSIVNAKMETPLHVACRSGANVDVIRHLLLMYPEAISQVNFHQQTPLQVAQKCNKLDDEALNHLQLEAHQ